MVQITYSKDSARQRHYVPPVLGNGRLSFMVDVEGCMRQRSYCGMTPVIVQAGCRYEDRTARLLQFGYFDQELPGIGDIQDFQQTLDLANAVCRCVCRYTSGLEAVTEIFCHAERSVIAVRKSFSKPVDFTFRYVFPEGPHMRFRNDGDGLIRYSAGSNGGFVRVHAPVLTNQRADPGTIQLFRKACKTAEILIALNEEICPGDTFDSLFAPHRQQWEKYWSVSRISVPDEAVMKMYWTAQYHLKVFSTPWSIPTGLFPSHWEGRFFAYDEFYTHGALLSSGHLAEALKIDHFRYSILDKAKRRACHCRICPEENQAARFPWETREDGLEGAPDGFWMDRYVHIANAAFSAWESWQYVQDKNLLEQELYPLIRPCAEYIRRSGVYMDSLTGPYIGKCTDMERFGEFIERPYSTTCGAIAAFHAAAECAQCLGKDSALQQEWRTLSEKLYNALPQENGRYVPYPGCTQHSIAMYHGIFPYGVIPTENILQKQAIAETEEHFDEFAGQYSKGGRLSAWYAGVIATAEVRRGNLRKALQMITEAANYATGCFYECFEVYEKEKLPWFTTASGALIRAVNELLLYAAENEVELWQGKDFSFLLPRKSPGGMRQFEFDSKKTFHR